MTTGWTPFQIAVSYLAVSGQNERNEAIPPLNVRKLAKVRTYVRDCLFLSETFTNEETKATQIMLNGRMSQDLRRQWAITSKMKFDAEVLQEIIDNNAYRDCEFLLEYSALTRLAVSQVYEAFSKITSLVPLPEHLPEGVDIVKLANVISTKGLFDRARGVLNVETDDAFAMSDARSWVKHIEDAVTQTCSDMSLDDTDTVPDGWVLLATGFEHPEVVERFIERVHNYPAKTN